MQFDFMPGCGTTNASLFWDIHGKIKLNMMTRLMIFGYSKAIPKTIFQKFLGRIDLWLYDFVLWLNHFAIEVKLQNFSEKLTTPQSCMCVCVYFISFIIKFFLKFFLMLVQHSFKNTNLLLTRAILKCYQNYAVPTLSEKQSKVN